MMLRRVLCRRVSRWRSRGAISCQSSASIGIATMLTSNACRRSYVHFKCRLFRLFVAALDLDRTIDCANDGIAIVSVSRGTVSAVQMGKRDLRRYHYVFCTVGFDATSKSRI